MASSPLSKLLMLCFLLKMSHSFTHLDAAAFQLISTDTLNWPSFEEDEDDGLLDRRSLYYQYRGKTYISYGALVANTIPCPARTGYSYYYPNCHSYHPQQVNPYTRGCSAITQCRR